MLQGLYFKVIKIFNSCISESKWEMRRLKIRYFIELWIIDIINNEMRKTVLIKIINKIIR